MQLAEFEVEAVGAGILQQGVAPAVAQHPVDYVAAAAVVGDYLLFGVEAGLGGRDPESILIGVGGQLGQGEGQIHPQAGAAATGGAQQPLDTDVFVVKTGGSQQRHVLLAAVKMELHQLVANALVQYLMALHQGGIDLLFLLLQQLVGQGTAEQLAEGKTGQQRQTEQQQSEPEWGDGSQGAPA